MESLRALQALGLELPTPAYLIGTLLFGIVGAVAWWHGKRTRRPKPKWLGLALMLYPYATPQTWLMYVVGSVLCVWLAIAWS